MTAPDQLTLKRHRDLVGRERRPFARWAVLSALGLLCLLGLLNAFGQRPQTTATASGAELEVYSPERLRSGLFFMSRFTIRAKRGRVGDAHARPRLARGDHPEHARAGPRQRGEPRRSAFKLGHVPAGDEHVFFLHFQVNPTEVGRRHQDVALYDGEERLLSIDRTVTICP